jgi:hypothetical protein
MLAVFAVFAAPAISRRVGDVVGLGGALLGLAALLAAMAVLHDSQVGLVACVVVAGRLPRHLEHAHDPGRHGVRTRRAAGRLGGLQLRPVLRRRGPPFIAGRLGGHVGEASPFVLGAAMTAIATGVLWFYRESLVPTQATVTPTADDAGPGRPASEPAPTPLAHAATAPMVVAVTGGTARQVSAMAVPIAGARGAAVHVLHVAERDVVAGMDAADLETPEEAEALLEASIAELSEAGVSVDGEVLRAVGSHADVAETILRRAGRLGAGLIVIGPDSGRTRLHPTITGRIAAGAPSHVIVLNPRAGALGRPHPAAGTGDGAALWRAAGT